MKYMPVEHYKSERNKYNYSLYVLEKFQQEEWHVDTKFQKNQNIKKSTKIEDYSDIFLPFSRTMKGNEEMVRFGKMTKWTNLKAVIYVAG